MVYKRTILLNIIIPCGIFDGAHKQYPSHFIYLYIDLYPSTLSKPFEFENHKKNLALISHFLRFTRDMKMDSLFSSPSISLHVTFLLWSCSHKLKAIWVGNSSIFIAKIIGINILSVSKYHANLLLLISILSLSLISNFVLCRCCVSNEEIFLSK